MDGAANVFPKIPMNYTKIKFAKVTFPGNKSFHNIFLFLLEVESPTNVILPILETSLGPDISGVRSMGPVVS